MVRAVDTGIINVCVLFVYCGRGVEIGSVKLALAVQESEYKLNLGKETEAKGKQKST